MNPDKLISTSGKLLFMLNNLKKTKKLNEDEIKLLKEKIVNCDTGLAEIVKSYPGEDFSNNMEKI